MTNNDKTKILKSLLNILPAVLLAVALMRLYQANMELKYDYEALAWQTSSETRQLDAIDATLFRRAQQNARNTNGRAASSQFPLAHDEASSKATQ